jgi:hypothetical protein
MLAHQTAETPVSARIHPAKTSIGHYLRSFYFIAPAEMLASPFCKKYLRLTRELWGDEEEGAESTAPDRGRVASG